MVQTLLTPSGADWDHISARPSPAEQYVAGWFEERLPAGWEIYVRPYLNGPTPSLVLLHPQYGIGVYEVVNPKAVRYTVNSFGSGYGEASERHILQADGNSLEGLENPYLLVRHYKERIARLCTDVIGSAGYGLITAGLVFTERSTKYWEELFAPFRQGHESKSMNPICGSDLLTDAGRVNRVLRRAYGNTAQSAMTQQVADLLRLWLQPINLSGDTGDPFVLDASQSRIVNSDPGASGYRRVKGPAGSGKSLVLAARAAQLASQPKRVLITCFNITLRSYLHELMNRSLEGNVSSSESLETIRRRVEIHHYHDWLYWHIHEGRDCLCVNEGICRCPPSDRFDAIMVDEGQDFKPEWWSHLRLCALKEGGEVLFAADATQDLYGRSKSWTDSTMRNAGFRGPWNTLEYHYRVPSKLIPALREFAANFMQDRAAELPTVVQGELPDQYPLTMRWIQITDGSRWGNLCLTELQRVLDALPNSHSKRDVAFLFWDHEHGFDFVSTISKGTPVGISHIFVPPPPDDDSKMRGTWARSQDIQRRSRPLKMAFPQYPEELRTITTHSYKGWEARHLLIYVDNVNSGSEGWSGSTLFYVALTRLMRDAVGSSLTVVSSCPELAEFGQRHFADYSYRVT